MFLWSIFLIVFFFGSSILVHELGHFLAARWRGVRVERFSIGFGPKILSWKGRDGVDYRLSWLPLGGYVALPQLADMQAIEGETQTDVSQLPPVSYPTRMIVFVAGVVFNVIFAFLLACIIWIAGQPTRTELDTTKVGVVLPTITLPDRSTATGPAMEAGIKPGDIIRAIDGTRVANWPDLQQTLYASGGRADDGRPKVVITIERAGRVMDLAVYPRLAGEESMRLIGIAPAEEMIIASLEPGRLGASIGLKPQDRIIAYDGAPLFSRDEFAAHLARNRDRPIALDVMRGDSRLTLTLPPRPGLQDFADLGIQRQTSFLYTHPDPFRQLSEHFVSTYRYVVSLLNPHSDISVSKLTGPVGIVRGFYASAQADIRLVLWFTILVNVSLAIFNLLPIPILDGGHMLFSTIAWIRGRALPEGVIMTAQSISLVLLLSLFLYVTFFDFRRLVRDHRPEPPRQTAPATPAAP